MAATGERPRMELRGLKKRGEVLGAVLALEGSSTAELKRASALTATMADRCILVAVDGGLKTCRAARCRPDLYVGDGDSSRTTPTDIPAVVLSRDKDFSDLAAALSEIRSRKAQVVAVAGMAGGRLDHEWANLFELASCSRSFAGIIAPTDRGTVVVTCHGCTAATVRGRTFSLFAMSPSTTVTLVGTEWKLQRRRLRPGSHGLSNITGTELDLTVHTGVVALVLLPPRRRRQRRKASPAGLAGTS